MHNKTTAALKSPEIYYLEMKVITLNWPKGKLLLTVKTGCMVYGL